MGPKPESTEKEEQGQGIAQNDVARLDFPENKINEYRDRLVSDFPDLAVNSLLVIGSGWHHDAVEVNSSIIFRMPRGVHEVSSTVDNEVSILQLMQGKLSIKIPDPLYISPSREYFGYPKVEGVLLRDLVKEFDKDDWQELKQDWVSIAKTIHSSVPLEQARELNLPDFIEPGPSPAERIFDMEDIDPDVLEFAARTIDQSKQLDVDKLQYVFLHNDLQFHNFIADKDTKKIVGLIDWTDACIGPLAREFAIYEWMKKGLLEEVAQLYERATGVNVDVKQAKMWRSLEELSDFVETTEAGDLKDAKETMLRIKNMMILES